MKYPIIPTAKPRMTQRDRWKQRPCVMKYRYFCDQIRAFNVSYIPRDHVVFWIPMPKSWSKDKKAWMNGQPHLQIPDIDNLFKALMDAIYKNDSGVWKISAEKRWAYEGSIEIRRIE